MKSTTPLNVLVLGVGGNVSQGIVKALRTRSCNDRIVGACISSDAAGLFLCDDWCLSPLAFDPAFDEWLIETCLEYSVDVVLSGVESVLEVLANRRSQIESVTQARCIVSEPDIFAIAHDKQATCEWLGSHGFDHPRSWISNQDVQIEPSDDSPIIAKPRHGKGSQGIQIITDASQLESYKQHDDYVFQECVGSDEAEFTVATVSNREFQVAGAVVMKRKLMFGTSVVIDIVNHPTLRKRAIEIATVLRPMGPCNMQFRMDGDRPVCFEINARFSGTAPIRAHFGFNDVGASLDHFIHGLPLIEMPNILAGRALRYWNEVYPETSN